MRLHRLSLGAVGPFAAAYDLDLDRVAAGGLFLLEGPTGAGKSTVLDAITFALYGSVAGRSTSKERLHSDFAGAVDPFVELELSVGGARFRVRRTPAHSRQKRDGSGTTPVQATVRLWRSTAAGEELVSNRVREADDEIRDLLGGLSRDQFCQVVVLPQGEFATFLRADADERRDVLQRLFSTDHYEAVERALVEMRSDARQQVERAETLVRDALAALVEASGDLDLDVGALLDLADDVRRTRLDLAEDVLHEAADRAEAEERSAAAGRDAAAAAHAAAVERARLAEVRRDAEALREVLLARDATVADTAAELDAATRAAGVAPLVAAVAEAELEVRRQAAVLASVAPSLDPDRLPDGLPEALAESRAALAALEPLVTRESALEVRRRELAALVEHRDELLRTVEALAAQRVAVPAQVVEARAELAAADTAAATLDDVTNALAAARDRLAHWASLPSARAEVARAEEVLRAAVDDAQAARDRHQDLVARRLLGMAAELAAALDDGDPCPVCGSPDHPAPAQPGSHVVDDTDLAEADRAWQQAHERRTAATDALAAARGALEVAAGAAGGEDPAPLVAELVAREAAAREAGERLADLRTAVAALEAEAASVRERVQTAEIELAALAERIASTSAACDADAAALAAVRGDAPSVLVAARTVRAQVDVLARTVAAVELLDRARRALATASALAEDAARHAGFPDARTAAGAVRDPDVVARSSAAVRAHHEAWAVLRSTLADPAVRTADLAPPDIAPAERALAEAEAARDAARAAGVAARSRVSRVRACRAMLDDSVGATAGVRAATRPVVRVADAATGVGSVNPRRITLSSYVLRERFDSVVAAASRRLELMSSGRYVLERDESTSGNKKAGLGLAVLDQWTGVRRDTRTLSGGESFYASLALALGLADVVRDEAGGVELETLFIDEGFGSLDPDALESVLDVIDSLRDGGRVVGIVSHVAELKERVPDRIEVRRRPDGTSAVAVRA